VFLNFELFSPINAQNVIKNREKIGFGFCFGRIFCKNFSTRCFFAKRFFDVEEKLTSKFLSIFLEKVFDMDFLQKYFYGAFELPLPLPRNAQKRTLKKNQEKKRMVGGWVWDLANVRAGPSIFFCRPLV
jgi:hypothetical protein